MASNVGPEDLKAVMGSFASGVTLVTTRDAEGNPSGLTVSAFSSVSLTPALCLVCIDNRGKSLAAILASGVFGVSMLRSGQEAISNRFASRVEDRFAEGTYFDGPRTGVPLLEGALATIECELVQAVEAGDHHILVGALCSTSVDPSATPLVYWRGGYRGVT